MQTPKILITQFLLTAAGCLLLAGCVSRTNTAIIQANGLGANPAGPIVLNKTAVAGQTINIISLTAVNMDCTGDDPGIIKITQQPSHGNAVIVQRDVFPNYPTTNPRNKCNAQKFPGVALDYTPTNGYTGDDLMAFEIITHSGTGGNEIKTIVTVK